MAANTSRIFPITPNFGAAGALLYSALTNTKAFDGTEAAGTNMALAFTAGAFGSKLDRLQFFGTSRAGTTGASSTTATLLRAWINNGSVNTTAGNNILIGEIAIPALVITALSASIVNAVYEISLPMPLVLPASYRVYVGSTIAMADATVAIGVRAWGGDY